MNSTSADESIECFSTKEYVSIATGIVTVLLLISETLPYFKPNDKCNGIIHSLQYLLSKKPIK